MVTGLLEILYAILLVLLWATVLFSVIRIVLTLKTAWVANETVPALLWRFRNKLLFHLLVMVVAGIITMKETAFRPKVSVNPSNPALEQKLKRVDESTPTISPAKPERLSWDEQQKKNREDNEEAKKEFERLPNKK